MTGEAPRSQAPGLRTRLVVAALAVLLPLGALGVGIVVALDGAESGERGGIVARLVVWILAVLATLGAAWFTHRVILRPLRTLAAAARDRATGGGGAPDAALPTTRDDEIGALARAIEALADRLEEALHELDERATRDAETGFLTPKELRRRLDEELVRGRRHEHEVAIVLLDVDTSEGDVISVAAALRGSVRPADLLARLSDTTFAAVLPHTGLEGTRVVARRIRSGLGPTLSGTGAAVAPAAGSTTDQLLQAAQAALDDAHEDDGQVHLYGEG